MVLVEGDILVKHLAKYLHDTVPYFLGDGAIKDDVPGVCWPRVAELAVAHVVLPIRFEIFQGGPESSKKDLNRVPTGSGRKFMLVDEFKGVMPFPRSQRVVDAALPGKVCWCHFHFLSFSLFF